MLKSGVVVEVQQRLCCANQCNEVYVQAKKVVTISQYHIMKFKLIFTIYLHVQINKYVRVFIHDIQCMYIILYIYKIYYIYN